jgi:hypothetical protein
LSLSQAQKIALISDTIVESAAVTFYVWVSTTAWLAWRRSSTSTSARDPTPLQRAQVAVLLSGGVAARVPSPILAAVLAYALAPEDELPLSFFRDAAGAVAFGDAQLAAFRAAVAAYMADSEAADKLAWQAHGLSGDEDDAPAAWVDAAALAALAPLAPSYASAAAARGLVITAGAPGEGAAALRALRAASAKALFKAGAPPADVYEYDPRAHTLTRLLAAPSGATPPEGWFVPEALASMVRVSDAADADAAAPKPAATLEATAAALSGAVPELRAPDALLYAALATLAAGGAAAAAAVPSALRAALRLPADADASASTGAAAAGAALLDATGGGFSGDAHSSAPASSSDVSAAPLPTCARPMVDVGSGLTKHDWTDLDDKELVARTRAGGSFKVMQAITPWSADAGTAAPLRREEAFEYFFLQRREHNSLWRRLAEECFPEEYAAASTDKARKKALSSRTPGAVLEELRKLKAPGAGTLAWLEALARGGPEDMLLLRRAALRVGPGSPEWVAASASWGAASARTRAAAAESQHACTNKAGAPAGAPPMRYKHQEELLSLVGEHLAASAVSGGGYNKPGVPPLRVVLSTPTGSGKTFTALMTSLQLLQPKHAGTILVYSVPTKQVLKRVGQECEAHAVVYWTAARDGSLYQVRRPYSIRTKREKDQKGSGSGTMKQQLQACFDRGEAANDRNNSAPGVPTVIVADVYATAALCATAAAEEVSSPFHASRMVLYLDEPNMGIHMSSDALDVVRRIMAAAPHTAVLASATLAPWPELPAWWRGDASIPAKRVTLSQPPYDLPSSRLSLLDPAAGEMRAIAVTDLFPSHAAFAAAVSGNDRLRVLLLRHLTPSQANALLAAADEEDTEASAAAGDGAGGDDAALTMAAWAALQPDVRTARETLEAALLRIGPVRFDALRRAWRDPPAKAAPALGLRVALSSTGVTMIATLEPRRVALQLSGWRGGAGEDNAEWDERVHNIKNRRRESSRVAAAAAKERERDAKRDKGGDEAGGSGPPPGGAADGAAGMELRPGLVITHEEAAAVDDDTLVMLSRGVAFACADGSEGALVKRLYQQALLHVPEDATRLRLPPIHALVVDYSSVYGTDCPAVDTLVLCDDLGAALTWEDHLQFLGRLRRDGRAVFLSARTLRAAAAATTGADEALENALESLPRAAARLTTRVLRDAAAAAGVLADGASAGAEAAAAAAAGGPAPAAALAAALAALRKSREPHAPSAGDLARHTLAALLSFGYAAPADVPAEDKPLFATPPPAGQAPATANAAAARKLVSAWGGALKPLLRTKNEQAAFLRSWEGACAEAGEAGARRLITAPIIVKALYDDDILGEEAVLAWAASAKTRAAATDKDAKEAAAAAALLVKLGPIVTWLQEADSDSEEESD